MERTTTAARLNEIMQERNLSQSDVITLTKPYIEISKTEISKANMSMYVSGKVKPAQDKLYLLGRALNVSEAWLMGYDVPRERTQAYEPVPRVISVDGLTKSEIEQLIRYKDFIIANRQLKKED